MAYEVYEFGKYSTLLHFLTFSQLALQVQNTLKKQCYTRIT